MDEAIQKSLISILIPVYNEEKNLLHSIDKIVEETKKANCSFEIVIVDDGSKDKTWDVINKLSDTHKNLHAIRLSRNFGKEAALCACMENARGEAALVIDSDLQHPPNNIPRMVDYWKNDGFEVVEGIKIKRPNESLVNKTGAALFYSVISYLSGFDFLGASDFKLIDRKVIDAWLRMGERNTFFRGMMLWLGFKRKQIEFESVDREIGKTKWSFYNLFRLAITAVTSFTTFPLHIVTLFGVMFLILSFGLGIQTLYMKFMGNAVEGFSTVILLILIIGSVLMISLGIIGEYIARIYEELKHRPRFIISESVDYENEMADTEK